MANYPKKTSTPIAVNHRTNIPITITHDTTSNFMDFDVSLALEMVGKSGINMTHNVFSRMTALNVPTYGDAQIHSRAFFVPFRTVFPAWNDFITDAVHTYSDNHSALVESVPLISNTTFVDLFIDPFYGLSLEDEFFNTEAKYDFVSINHGESRGFFLTPSGARFMKLLNALGYRIDFNEANSADFYSALPLLCACKVYYDWYYPSSYMQDDLATSVSRWFVYNNYNIPFDSEFGTDALADIANFLGKVCYDSSYFVSACDNPATPNDGSYSDYTIRDVEGFGRVKVIDSPGTSQPVLYPGASDTETANPISQFALTALKSLTDYMKRHQIAGSRALDRYLSRFGVTLSAEKLNRSVYISEYTNNQDINFGDVTSTSDTSAQGGAPLGAYAGKGISAGRNQSFEFSTDEYGMLIVVSTVVPRESYTQGINRHIKHLTRLDFYTPEFDNLGYQAIYTKELFVPFNSAEQYADGDTTREGFNYSELAFGFTPRYAEYKVGKDIVTGDYNLGSRNVGLDAWLLNRDIAPLAKVNGVQRLYHSQNFLSGEDADQYNRIFNGVIDERVDHFKVHHIFSYNLSFPGTSLYDNYEFDDEDKSKRVNLDVVGVKNN